MRIALTRMQMRQQGAMTKGARLFNKNLTDCEPVKVCIVSDACPVPVLQSRFQPTYEPVNGGGNYNSLKVNNYGCLSKIWPYAGKSENPTLPLDICG